MTEGPEGKKKEEGFKEVLQGCEAVRVMEGFGGCHRNAGTKWEGIRMVWGLVRSSRQRPIFPPRPLFSPALRAGRARARPRTVSGESSGPKIILVPADFILVLG